MFKSYDHFKKFSLEIINSIKSNPSKKLSENREDMAQLLIGSDCNTLKSMFENKPVFSEYFVAFTSEPHDNLKEYLLLSHVDDESVPYLLDDKTPEECKALIKSLITERNSNFEFFKDLTQFIKDSLKENNIDILKIVKNDGIDSLDYMFDELSSIFIDNEKTLFAKNKFIAETKRKFGSDYMLILGSLADADFFEDLHTSYFRMPEELYNVAVANHIDYVLPLIIRNIAKSDSVDYSILNDFVDMVFAIYKEK